MRKLLAKNHFWLWIDRWGLTSYIPRGRYEWELYPSGPYWRIYISQTRLRKQYSTAYDMIPTRTQLLFDVRSTACLTYCRFELLSVLGRPLTGRCKYSLTSSVFTKLMIVLAHQIRVHLQYLGHSIANDPVYSETKIWVHKIFIYPYTFLDWIGPRERDLEKAELTSYQAMSVLHLCHLLTCSCSLRQGGVRNHWLRETLVQAISHLRNSCHVRLEWILGWGYPFLCPVKQLASSHDWEIWRFDH